MKAQADPHRLPKGRQPPLWATAYLVSLETRAQPINIAQRCGAVA